ncbi:PR5-like receptor kinase [Neltuma alba]|uniref:PR5-like receptor kinase n=1 Tax=Neltuma alba TaxID=207710 RepID=UPI0010A56E6D|nr:PR5-like receptor kinase [Prosopis alba]XP_028803893.1 PR5-like receptor kinase [Prosopis alba]
MKHSYSEINKLTNGFKHKLGEGRYGHVFQGKLQSKRDVAVKILHLDIKPHNILLDENFDKKVSDFGLSKLYSLDDSIVSLTNARGTLGYKAPELFYKNIGGISHKADVYSIGMLFMEMAGRRKNLNVIEHSWQTHFAKWVYDQFEESIEVSGTTGEEREIAMKMIVIASHCIQMNPSDPPSMKKVIEMLEGEIDLQVAFPPYQPSITWKGIPKGDVELLIYNWKNLNSE